MNTPREARHPERARGRSSEVVLSEPADPDISMISMDRETSSIVVARSDGMEARFPLEDDAPFADTSALSSLHFTPTLDRLLAVTRAGDEIVFELLKLGDGDRRADRLVVYFDQNQWSAVANVRRGPDGVREEDGAAAQQVLIG